MSRILIVGSHRAHDVDRAFFERTCNAIGYAIATKRHELLVCSSSDNTADWHAVSGANRAGENTSTASVSYFVARDEFPELGGISPYSPSTFPNIDMQLRITTRGWFSTYDTAASQADAIIAVGGTPRGTGGALYITLAKGKPGLAIPALGGFSEESWRDFANEYSDLRGEDQIALGGTDPNEIARAAVDSVERLIANNPFSTSRKGLEYALIPASMLAAGAAWVYATNILVSTPIWISYLLALTMAAAGMLFRYTTDDARRKEAYAGATRVYKDSTRVIGALLGLSLLLKLAAVQVHNQETDSGTLLTTWLALGGFTAGFLIEEVTGMLTRTLTAALGVALKGDK
jgi:hypothetical protein